MLALIVRVVSLVYASQLPMFRVLSLDSQLYDEAGKLIASGDWAIGRDVLHMSPAYSYFVGITYRLFGVGPWGPRVVQLLLGTITVGCIHASARRLFNERWALLTGLLAALYGPFIFYDTELLADGLATALNAALLWLLIRACESRPGAVRPWIPVGAVWGLAIITRPNALLLAVPIALAVLLKERAWPVRAKALVVAGVCGVAVVVPVTARNLVVAGERVLVTDTGGMNFYIGNGPDSAGTFHAPPELPEANNPKTQFVAYRAFAEKTSGRSLSAREVDSFWMARTWRYISRHPAQWLRLMLEKLWLFWNAREISNTEDYGFARTLNPVLGLPLPQFGWLAPFALIGTVLWFLRRRREELVVATTNAVLCAANVAVFILARYRISAVPGLILAAVGAVCWLGETWKVRSWSRLGLAAAAFVPLLVLVWTPKMPASPDRQWLKLGNAYYSTGDFEHAQWAFSRAVGFNADDLSAQKNLGIVCERLGQRSQAKEHWQQVARIAAAAHRSEYARDAAAHLQALAGP